ncbi:hypothetical protein ES722_09190 [Campylobacter coli]|nr:hypothetical protein [Campylobacter coli]EAL4449820.1 hypothetical protein [Campylobacter coli]
MQRGKRGKRGVLRVLNIAFSFRLLRSYCTEFFVRPRSKKDQKKKALPLNKSLNLAFSQKLNSFRLSHYNKRALRFFAPKKAKKPYNAM